MFFSLNVCDNSKTALTKLVLFPEQTTQVTSLVCCASQYVGITILKWI